MAEGDSLLMSTSRETIFCEYPEDVADAAAAMIHHVQSAAISERGVFRIALSGGSTPSLLYDALLSEWRDEMEWEKWEVYWSDERAVPPHSEHSNFHLAMTRLLSKVPVGNIFRMPADDEDLSLAAAEYGSLLKTQFDSENPVFDLILLGMGSDGHTASLFPGNPVLESGSLIAVVETEQEIRKRLTFTLRTINHARLVFFLVIGEDKADKVKEILVDENYANPAMRVDPKEGRVIWFIDEAAASKFE
jgi:6-phosphogluconolactonase